MHRESFSTEAVEVDRPGLRLTAARAGRFSGHAGHIFWTTFSSRRTDCWALCCRGARGLVICALFNCCSSSSAVIGVYS